MNFEKEYNKATTQSRKNAVSKRMNNKIARYRKTLKTVDYTVVLCVNWCQLEPMRDIRR